MLLPLVKQNCFRSYHTTVGTVLSELAVLVREIIIHVRTAVVLDLNPKGKCHFIYHVYDCIGLSY